MLRTLNSVFTTSLCTFFLCFSQGLYAQQAIQADAVRSMKQNANNTKNMAGMQSMNRMAGMKGMIHDHKPIALPANAAVPKIKLGLYRDKKDGFNLHLNLSNFDLEPPEFEGGLSLSKAKKLVVDGHAHLYINGKKISRLYGRYVHLPQHLFKPGINMVMVSLNAHNHDTWTIGKLPIMATLMLKPDQEKFILYNFSSSPPTP